MFDDTDPDAMSYLGMANLPLLSLAHDKPIRGEYELKTVSKPRNRGGNLSVLDGIMDFRVYK